MSKISGILRTLFALVGIVSCWWLAYTLYRTWQTPLAVENGRWVSLGVGIMVMEFFLVHSGMMLPAVRFLEKTKKLKLKPLLLICVMYVLFGIVIAAIFQSWMLFWSFSGIMISRWAGVAVDSDTALGQQIRRSAVSVALYLLVLFLSALVLFPPGGLTPEIVYSAFPDAVAYSDDEALWEANPQQALVAGIIYFGISGLIEALLLFRKSSRTNPSVLQQDKENPS